MKSGGRKKRLVVLMIFISAVSLLLAAALIGTMFLGNAIDVPLLRSENVYIVLILAVIFLVIIISMTVIVLRRGKLYKRIRERNARILAGEETSEDSSAEEGIAEEGEREAGSKSKETSESRFYMLTETDIRMKSYRAPNMTGITLKELCERFRNYAAAEKKLYYTPEDIRKFIAGMAVSRILIMQGMSGTGKTSLAYTFGEFLNNGSVIVPVQPMWKERTDLVGYYNEFTRKFNETMLLQKMYEANYSSEMYITVLDEMNIARVEYYFAEFLSLLEIPDTDKRWLDVVSDKWSNDPVKLNESGQIKLPDNMWFIGTANNDDSTFAISDKVYDRAMIVNLDRKSKEFSAPHTEGIKLAVWEWEKLVREAEEEYGVTARNLRRLSELDAYMIKTFRVSFGNRIMKQINKYVPIYVACGGDELEALDDILSKKIIRKLETQNPVYVKSMSRQMSEYLDELFGEGKMKSCKESLERLALGA